MRQKPAGIAGNGGVKKEHTMAKNINGAVSFGLLVLTLTLCHLPLALAHTVGQTTECDPGPCHPDQGFECEAGKTRTCDSQCGSGLERCENGFWRPCDAPQPCDEVCDGIDNDCNGEIDEGLTRACFDGFAALEDVGMCHAGIQACEEGHWCSCVGQTLPDDEVCDDGIDNDCDGDTDEGCGCPDGTTRVCGTNIGACQQGMETCVNSRWSACQGATGPSPEICDGLDNDCDGTINEDIADIVHYTGPDGTLGVGICRPGVAMCKTSVTLTTVAAEWSTCVGEVLPEDEFCDGLDNDCDGTTDEGCDCPYGGTWVCGEDTGACEKGQQSCDSGEWGDCQGAVVPAEEVCDGTIDENCDGQVDENCECVNGETRACGSPVGACEEGQQSCEDGKWGECIGGITAVPETCDGTDDNCDGATDEGCDCTPDGQTQDCGSATGACSPGTQACSDGQWSQCEDQVEAIAEACDDGIDNDCDGDTDEDCYDDYDPPPATPPDTDTDTETDSDTDPNDPANANGGSAVDDPDGDLAQASAQTDANGGGALWFEGGGPRSCQFSPARTATGASLWWLAVPLLAPAVWWRRRLQKSRPC